MNTLKIGAFIRANPTNETNPMAASALPGRNGEGCMASSKGLEVMGCAGPF